MKNLLAAILISIGILSSDSSLAQSTPQPTGCELGLSLKLGKTLEVIKYSVNCYNVVSDEMYSKDQIKIDLSKDFSNKFRITDEKKDELSQTWVLKNLSEKGIEHFTLRIRQEWLRILEKFRSQYKLTPTNEVHCFPKTTESEIIAKCFVTKTLVPEDESSEPRNLRNL